MVALSDFCNVIDALSDKANQAADKPLRKRGKMRVTADRTRVHVICPQSHSCVF